MLSKAEIRQRINEQSVLVSRCKRCGCFFVVDHELMGHDQPDLDPRIWHRRAHLNDMTIERLDNDFETHRLRGDYHGQKTVFFDELYLTEEQFSKLTNYINSFKKGRR